VLHLWAQRIELFYNLDRRLTAIHTEGTQDDTNKGRREEKKKEERKKNVQSLPSPFLFLNITVCLFLRAKATP